MKIPDLTKCESLDELKKLAYYNAKREAQEKK